MMKVSEASLSTCTSTLYIDTTKEPEFIDITSQVADLVKKSGIHNGFVVIYSKHTTAAVIIQENEPLLLRDLANALERYSPRSAYYRHNDFNVRTDHMHDDECPNGHSHCQHMVLGSSETIPVVDGTLPLGKWQRIFVVELDERGLKPREILVQILGV